MKAIETRYNGYCFRSRLEARWAVFFNALGVVYQYEKEGYDLGDGLYYLPDFFLPESEIWVEIKGGDSTKVEQRKAEKLFYGSEHPVVIAQGEPYYGSLMVFLFDSTDCSAGEQWWGEDERVSWYPNHDGMGILIENDFSSRVFDSKVIHRIGERGFEIASVVTDWVIREAAQKARSARFEHGEAPSA